MGVVGGKGWLVDRHGELNPTFIMTRNGLVFNRLVEAEQPEEQARAPGCCLPRAHPEFQALTSVDRSIINGLDCRHFGVPTQSQPPAITGLPESNPGALPHRRKGGRDPKNRPLN